MRSTLATAETAAGGAASGAAARGTREPLLRLEDVSVRFATPDGEIAAVSEISLSVAPGECVGVVGESGAGKSQAFLAVMGLLAANGRMTGRAQFDGVDLVGARPADLDRIRGSKIAMIFQDPMTSLTPHIPVGDQIAESLVRHRGVSWKAGRARALELLKRVHVTDAERRLSHYPHELSGGMRQRVMIAIALACDPKLVIADEPTTALDVTIQAQILALLAELKREQGMSMILITHDLGVVAGIADRVAVMYGGRLAELGPVSAVLKQPRHPYTRALLRSMPRVDVPGEGPLETIRGQPPNPSDLPPGCPFHPRCDFADALCRQERPRLVRDGNVQAACHHTGRLGADRGVG
jgi:oligopeptide transport system ATP-binding protein